MYQQQNYNNNDYGQGLDEDQQAYANEQYDQEWDEQNQGNNFQQPQMYQQQMNLQQFGGQNMNMGLGAQMSMPGQFMQAPMQAPMQGQEPIKMEPMEPMKFEPMSAKSFSATKEFVPAGKVANTQEQFPDLLGDMDEAPKKGGKKGGKKGKGKKVMVVATPKVEEEPVDDSLPWKGKKSSFFVMEQKPESANEGNPMGFEMKEEQWNFIFKFYPEYGVAPYDMMTWLYGQAKCNEDMLDEQYGKPTLGGEMAGGSDEEENLGIDSKYDKGFGPKKQTMKKGAAQKASDIADAKQKKLEDLKKVAGPSRTDAQREEQKVMKAYKDKDVNVNPDDLVEVDKVREPVSMCFIGHVDAGKSTISGQMMYMMGVVDVRTIEKYKQEARDKGRDSWWLAYVMDVSDEEKSKGKTVEVGRAQFDTPTKKYTIFDAPGHKNYVPNMIMGAAMADIGGLVISARKGEFEAGFEKEGQTREHAQLAQSLGVQKLVIIVNKMDDCKWSKTRWDEIRTGLTPFLNKTGYKDEDLIWVPISGMTGDNIQEKTDKAKWYDGPCLVDLLDNIKLEKRFPQGPLRIPILDKMKEKDLIVHGKVENGTVTIGDKLALMPSGNPCQVLGVLDAKGQNVKYAAPGENVQIRINIADEEAVSRGNVLCHRNDMMPVTQIFEAEVDILELLEYKPILSKGYNCIMHIHCYAEEVVVQDIIRSEAIDEKGELVVKQKPQFARSQNKIICRIAPKTPVALEKFETMQQMGRFTLRDENKTIAVGKVGKYKPYVKGVVGAAGSKSAAAVTKQMGAVTINQAPELKYDMETGELKPAEKKMDAIAEGNEDEDE